MKFGSPKINCLSNDIQERLEIISCNNSMVLVTSSVDTINSDRNYFVRYIIAGGYVSRKIFVEKIRDQMRRRILNEIWKDY